MSKTHKNNRGKYSDYEDAVVGATKQKKKVKTRRTATLGRIRSLEDAKDIDEDDIEEEEE